MSDYADYFIDGPGIDRTATSWNRYGKTKAKKVVSFSLNDDQAAKYKALGGAVAMRKLIEAAPLPLPASPEEGTS
jgi:hypothetical protein